MAPNWMSADGGYKFNDYDMLAGTSDSVTRENDECQWLPHVLHF